MEIIPNGDQPRMNSSKRREEPNVRMHQRKLSTHVYYSQPNLIPLIQLMLIEALTKSTEKVRLSKTNSEPNSQTYGMSWQSDQSTARYEPMSTFFASIMLRIQCRHW